MTMLDSAANAASETRENRAEGASIPRRRRGRNRHFAFWLLLFFFVMEYIRPEPFVRLKPQMICLVLFLVLWVRLPRRRRPWSRNLTLQVVFLGLCALSILFAHNYFSAYIATRTMYGNAVIALAITWLLSNRRDFVFAIWFWVAIMAFQASYALLHAGRGMGATLGDENDLALGINTALPFVFVGFRVLSGWRRWLCGALIILLLSAIVTSISRGGFVGLIAVILYCVFFGRNRIRNLSLAIAGGLVFYLAIPDSYKTEIESIQQTNEGTAEARFFLWASAWNMWKDNPVFGVGAGNSIWNVGRYQPEGTDSGMFSGRQYHERNFTMTAIHSAFFQVLSEMGILGSAVFIALVGGHFSGLLALRRRVERQPRVPPRLRRENELYTVALGGAMAGYLVAGAFLSVVYYPYPWYFSAFAVAWWRAVDAELRSVQAGSSLPKPRLTRASMFA